MEQPDVGEVVLDTQASTPEVKEEFSAGGIWIALLAVAFAAWWLRRRRGADTRTAGGVSAAGDAELLRKKRLEALQKLSSAMVNPEAAGRRESAETTDRSANDQAVAAAPAALPVVAAVAPSADPRAQPPTASPPVQQSASSPTPPLTIDSAPSQPSSSSSPPPVVDSEFIVIVRGQLCGSAVAQEIRGLTVEDTIASLKDQVLRAFLPCGENNDSCSVRLFLRGKELKVSEATLASASICSGATLTVMFPSATEEPASIPTAAKAPAPQAVVVDPGLPFALRVQGTLSGTTVAHSIEGLTACTTVLGLEARVFEVFGVAAETTRLRLFYMGRELKDSDLQLGCIPGGGVKPGSTVQAMFAPGKGPAGAAATADVADVASAIASVAAAAGLDPALLQPGASQPAQAATPADEAVAATPAEAWAAVAQLEAQLRRGDDPAEEAASREAARVLKQMLTTMAHGSNPALLQMAQSMVPDIKKIWSFEPTRDYLMYLLGMSPSGNPAAAATAAPG